MNERLKRMKSARIVIFLALSMALGLGCQASSGDRSVDDDVDAHEDVLGDSSEPESCEFHWDCSAGMCEDGICVAELSCTGPTPADCCCGDGYLSDFECSDGEWLCNGAYELNGSACSDECGPCFSPCWDRVPDSDAGGDAETSP